MLNEISCPACKSSQVHNKYYYYNNYQIRYCSFCQCEFCIPFIAPHYAFYSEAKDSESLRRHNSFSDWDIQHPTCFSVNFENGNGKLILDIGCGNGDFASFAVSRGFEVIGIDIDTESLKIANQRKLANAIFLNSTLENYCCNNNYRFDIVSMFEVYEHLDSPFETILLIKRMLKPTGIFVGTLPNENRIFAKRFNLSYAKPPYHLTYWNIHSWSNYLINIHHFQKIICSNSVYYGYLCNILQEKLITALPTSWRRGLPAWLIKAALYLPRKLETRYEKWTGRSSSFYFEFRLPAT